jgi:hypothetical protein
MNRCENLLCVLLLAVVAAALIPACGDKKSSSGVVHKTAPIQFVLSSEGLAADGMWKCTPEFADVNGDGQTDLAAIVRLGTGANVWLGNGAGKWVNASVGLGPRNSCGGGVAFGDVNRDGFLDLAVADHCQGAFVYLGNGRGHWKVSVDSLNPAVAQQESEQEKAEGLKLFIGAEDLALGDVNEDGFLDLVVASSDQGGISVYLGDGTGSAWREVLRHGLPNAEDPASGDEDKGGWANQVLLVDIDKDEHLDVVASYHAGPRVWLGDGTGRWRPASNGLPTPVLGGLFRGIAVGDVNEDGLLDLAVANDVNGPEIFLRQRDGSWQPTPDVLPSMQGGAVAVALGDLDGDGHLDLLVGGREKKGTPPTYGIFACRGDGRGNWAQLDGTGLPPEGLSVTWGITAQDLNGDGLSDFAVTTGGTDSGRRTIRPDSKGAIEEKKESSSAGRLPRLQVWLTAKPK